MPTTPQVADFFRGIAFVVVPVQDIARARQFYERKLGLAVTTNWQDEWIEYDIGTGTLAVTAGYPGRQPGTPGALVAVEVGDFDALLVRLRKQGVALAGEPFDTPACRGVTVRDPDGNDLLLHARK